MNALTRDRIITIVWTISLIGSSFIGNKAVVVMMVIGVLLFLKALMFPTDYNKGK